VKLIFIDKRERKKHSEYLREEGRRFGGKAEARERSIPQRKAQDEERPLR
jgi:hypothetical protein